ncbi:MAG: Rossmann-like domain-containing protein [Promethearchaeota archaeon]
MSSRLAEIAQRTIELIQPSINMPIKNVVIGLLYSGVQLENGTVGVSYTLTDRKNDLNAYHQLLQEGFLSEKSLEELIDFCFSEFAIQRTIGVAALNSLSQAHIDYTNATDQDVSELLDITSDSLVGMVGNIHPITRYLSKKNVSLRILDEYNPVSNVKNITPASKVSDLEDVDHILISGSALVFDSLDEIIKLLPQVSGCKILVGPSAQVLPEVAFQLGFSLVGSSRIINAENTLCVLQQGGGYRFFKKYTQKYSFVKRFESR